ncbi:MAG: hypothetical protein V9G04_11395 [Nocardioides sp.]
MDPLRQHDLGFAELHREQHLAPQRAHLDAALTLVRRSAGDAATGHIEFAILTTGSLADDGVRRAPLTEVDPRLITVGREVAQRPLPRLLALGPLHRAALGLVVERTLVGVRRDHAVAVGVDGVQVGPVAAALVEPGLVELAYAQRQRAHPAVQQISVDVEDRSDRVVRPDLLLLLEAALDEQRIHDRQRGRLGGDIAIARILGDLAGILGRFDGVDAVRQPGRLHVARDVGRFLVAGRRVDRELLQQPRPDQAEQHRGDEHQRQTGGGQTPGALPDVGEEQQRTDHRDPREDLASGHHRVLVGVVHPRDQRTARAEHVVAAQPIVDALQQHEDAEQHRQLHLRSRAEPIA